jgi:RNA polymerase sigma-70 factor (ECF subfamily)
MTNRDLVLADADARTSETDTSAVPFQMDEDAFRGFYHRTARALWVYLHRLTGSRAAADDLLQDAYYRLLRATIVFDSETHRRRYLFRIATNLARDTARRQRARPVMIAQDDAPEPGTLDASRALDDRLDISQAMTRLGKRERAMLLLAYTQGATHEEIAAIVGVRTSSIKPLLFRARRRLRRLLGRGVDRP